MCKTLQFTAVYIPAYVSNEAPTACSCYLRIMTISAVVYLRRILQQDTDNQRLITRRDCHVTYQICIYDGNTMFLIKQDVQNTAIYCDIAIMIVVLLTRYSLRL